MQDQDFDLCIFSDLLNTGETPGQKVSPLRSFEPELPVLLAQSCVSSEYLMKAKLWGDVNRKMYGFLYTS
jgi:hypothetical protein